MSGASFVLVGSLFGLKGALHSPPLSLLTRFVLLLSKSSHWYLFLQDLVSDFIFRSFIEDEDDEDNLNSKNYNFQEAVALFNSRDYYRCHDVLETLWNESQEPSRTLLHGILQCAVGFHHLFNQNHKGAMMELGEGLCKLRKFNFENGPFYEFEKDISQVLNFIYRTQIELAACSDDFCVTMDQSERSYQLLGGFAAGQKHYSLASNCQDDYYYLVFSSGKDHDNVEQHRIKLPTIDASEENLKELEYI
ncbi:putative aquaporin sip2.1 [Capsicum annuum]|nr:putative aquaporin sip2.1 [Capsicum annuum]